MKLDKATVMLKIVLALGAIALGLVLLGGVPGYMSHVIHVRPSLRGWDFWMKAYATLISLPVWAVIVILWMVFDTLPKNEAFTMVNVTRFRWIARLAVVDLVLVGVLGAFLVISGVTPAFLMMCVLLAVCGGLVVTIVFQVLAGLLQNAVQLKQDSDMTI